MIIIEKTAIFSNKITKRQTSIIDFFKKNNIKTITDIGSGRLRLIQFYVESGICCNLVETQKQIDDLYIKNTPTQELLKSLQQKSLIGSIFNSETFKDTDIKTDAITCSFVLCVIPLKEKRDNLLLSIRNKLQTGQFALIEVRSRDDIERIANKTPQLDGYVVGKGKVQTFQKGYTKNELIEYVASFGFSCKKVFEDGGSVSILFEAL